MKTNNYSHSGICIPNWILTSCLIFLSYFSACGQATSDCGYAGTGISVGNVCTSVAFNSNNNTDYWNSAAGCGAADLDDAWWWFTATSTTTTITYNSASDAILTLFSGVCGPGMTSLACSNLTASGNETITYATTPGTQYSIRIQQSGSDASMNGTICVYSPNDTPCAASEITVQPSGTCTMKSFSNVGATDSGLPAPGCANYLGGDVWFYIVVPASGNVLIDSDAGTLNGMGMAAYSGTCGALTLIECDENDSGNEINMPMIALTGQPPGSTIWLRLWDRANNATGTFSICATNNTPPSNDEPCSATALTTGATCTMSTYTLQYATNSFGQPSVPQGSCQTLNSGYFTQDVWFTATIPASGYLDIQTDNLGISNSQIELYSGPNCSSLSLIGCYDDGGQYGATMSDGYAVGAPGQTIWVRVWEKWGDVTGTFRICAKSNPYACGGSDPLLLNDFCQNPASLTWNPPATFAASTAASFTADNPANFDVDNFTCGTIQNNSWYSFVAGQNGLGDGIDTFAITTIANCATASNGIQAHVYEVITDVNGCCTAFTNVSNCLGNQTTVPAYVIATGLVPGNSYVLMIDGYAGNNCDFVISGWGATGVLPIELVELSGVALPDKNLISWKTASEYNNDYFEVFRSTNGEDFELIGDIDGMGTTNSLNTYHFPDYSPRNGINYYYIEQVDYNGNKIKSEAISIQTGISKSGLVSIYPNPTNDKLTVECYLPISSSQASLQLETLSGQVLEERVVDSIGMTYAFFDLSTLNKGIYLIKYTDSDGCQTERILKL